MAPHNNFRAPAPGLAAPSPSGARPFAVVAPMGAVGGTSVQLAAAQKDEAPGWQAEGDEGNTEPNSQDCAQQPPQVQAISAAGPTMTSREIAELTGKRHDNVMTDARRMLVELHGEDRLLSFQGTVERVNPSGGTGIGSLVYLLPKRETLILVSGYSVTVRARIIDRLAELERVAVPALPDFNDPAAAAIAWAEQFRAKQTLALQNAAQAAALAVAAPKAAGLDRIAAASEGAVNVRVAAKLADVPEGVFIDLLVEHGWLYRQGRRGGLLGKSDKERAGLVETKRVEVPRSEGAPKVVARVFITTRGLAKAAELIERKAPHLRKAKTATDSQQAQLTLPIEPADAQERSAP